MRIRILGCFLLGTLAAGCGSGSAGDWAGTVTDSAGVTVVSNPARALWDDGEAWRVEEELRIGALDGPPEYQFGQIAWIDTDSRGNIYVLDQQAQHVQVYDPEGSHLRTIGRPGTGPAELSQGALAVLVGPGDTVFVVDNGAQRVTRFLPDGTDAGSFGIPFTEGISLKWELAPDGRLLQQSRSLPVPGTAAQPPHNLILARNTEGAVLDTVLRLPLGESMKFEGGAPQFRLFEAEPIWEIDATGRLYTASNAEYRIEVRTPDGAVDRVITYPFERKPVTESDRQAILDELSELFEQQGVPPMARSQILQTIGFGDHFPAFATIVSGPDGTLWVQHIRTMAEAASEGLSINFENMDMGAPEWDVFDAEGRFLGVVTLPARFATRHVEGDRLYGIWRDELDVPYVMRLRVVRPADA